MAQAVARAGRPDGIVAGITGLSREAPAVSLHAGLARRGLRGAGTRVFVAEDMWIAYLSHFALGEGILVYSGTGSIGYFLGEDKETIRIGGHGNLIDDGGSGFWIAREALKAVLRADEEEPGAGWNTALGRTLAAAVGGATWNSVRTFVYGGAAVDRLARPRRRRRGPAGRRRRPAHPLRSRSRARPPRDEPEPPGRRPPRGARGGGPASTRRSPKPSARRFRQRSRSGAPRSTPR